MIRRYKHRDEDKDGLDDNMEIAAGIHDKNNNHIKSVIVGNNPRSSRGLIGVNHSIPNVVKNAKITPKKMKFKVDIPENIIKNQKNMSVFGKNIVNTKNLEDTIERLNHKMRIKKKKR